MTDGPTFGALILPFLGGLLGAGISGIVTWQVATRRLAVEQDGNQLASVLKVAEFRVAWIQELRDELTKLDAGVFTMRHKQKGSSLHDLAHCVARIHLLMNPSDPEYQDLSTNIGRLLTKPDGEDAVDMEARRALRQLGQRILKREWDRVRYDIRDRRIVDPNMGEAH